MFERLNKSKLSTTNSRSAIIAEVIGDSSRYQKTARPHSEVAEIVEKYREYKDLTRGSRRARPWWRGVRRRAAHLCSGRTARLGERLTQVENDLKVLLVPKDPNDDRTLCWKSAPDRW